MSRRCPECGHKTPTGVAPGQAYACPKCSNPVLASAHPPARGGGGGVDEGGGGGGGGDGRGASADAPTSSARPSPAAPLNPGTASSPSHWKLALLAFVVLGAAYVGAYELLTAEAQRDRTKLLAAHGEKVAAYPKPDAPASGDAKALRDYGVAQSLYEDRQRYEACESRIAAGRLGMAVAFGAQTLFAVFVYLKSRGARARAAAATARATSRA